MQLLTVKDCVKLEECFDLASFGMDSQSSSGNNVPRKHHGIGKALMTVWRATHPNGNHPPVDYLFLANGAAQPAPKRKIKDKHERKGRLCLQKQRKVYARSNKNRSRHKEVLEVECSLAKESGDVERLDKFSSLMDDEELELRESRKKSGSLVSCAHLTSCGGNHCALCKDLLGRFPPLSVRMKRPLSMQPWVSSPERVKKLFKVFLFLYSHAGVIATSPFTLEEFSSAIQDKDSLLLGQIHMALVKFLFTSVERVIDYGLFPLSAKNSRFHGFVQFVKKQQLDVKAWKSFLNPLTWAELLRQIMVAAGFDSKRHFSSRARHDGCEKEDNPLMKLGFNPGALKAELFKRLQEHGTNGMKISELMKVIQGSNLNFSDSLEDLEAQLISALSSDVKVFEKLSPCSYRIRPSLISGGTSDSETDIEDSGSVENGSVNWETDGSDDMDDFEELASLPVKSGAYVSAVNYEKRRRTSQTVEIDESHTGEAWSLGLRDGNYGDLSIDEKLDALVALVDLADAGSCNARQEAVDKVKNLPTSWCSGSGGKIKKSNKPRVSSINQIGSGTIDRHEILPFEKQLIDLRDVIDHKSHWMQAICLGSDRRYNRYWLFLGPCGQKDTGHRRVYFESSDDGHWEMIDTEKDLINLLSSLNGRGAREAQLLASLEKRVALLCQRMTGSLSDDQSETSFTCDSVSSPISDIDNNLGSTHLGEHEINYLAHEKTADLGKQNDHKRRLVDSLREYDTWTWRVYHSSIGSLRYKRRPDTDLFIRCAVCNDLYWRDEKHCMICHNTFELDIGLDERYIIHAATCTSTASSCLFPRQKVLSGQLQSLKAAVYAVEGVMPEEAYVHAWLGTGRMPWVKHLRRSSSVAELMQVLKEFSHALNEDWISQFDPFPGWQMLFEEVVVLFENIPQTLSSVALWLAKLDFLVTRRLDKVQDKNSSKHNLRKGRPVNIK